MTRNPLSGSALKPHPITVEIEDPIFRKLEDNVGKTKRFATKSHAINFSLAKELGVSVKE